jgi:hypothetical protein
MPSAMPLPRASPEPAGFAIPAAALVVFVFARKISRMRSIAALLLFSSVWLVPQETGSDLRQPTQQVQSHSISMTPLPPLSFCTYATGNPRGPLFYLSSWFPTLPHLFIRATGHELVAEPHNNLGLCDVIAAGPFTSPEVLKQVLMEHRSHALLIFHNAENMEATAHGIPGRAIHDHMAPYADVVFSNARDCLQMPDEMDIAGKIAIEGGSVRCR